jgi:hypothetical protein
MSMENTQDGQRIRCELTVIADMLNHHREIDLQVGENMGYLVQAPFDRIETRGRCFATAGDLFARPRRPIALEHGVKVLWFPAEGHGQRFQGSRATAALNGVPLNFAHYGWRHMRAFRKFALTPPKLIHALVDGFGDCRPILRHSFPPRSAFGAEVSRSPSFHDTTLAFSTGGPASSLAWGAEIIEISLKSALRTEVAKLCWRDGRGKA